MNTGFIGIGSRGGMLVRAFLRSGGLVPENVWAANRSQAKLDVLTPNFPGIHIASDRQLAAQCDLIFLCLSAVAKLIPSITQEIGAGIALLMYGSRVTTEDRSLLENLLGRISQPVVITESLARPAIGLASGGPALLAYLLQSMAEEAVRSNSDLSPELGRKLVQDTASATMRLMTEAGMTTEGVICRVAIPGGMTALAIETLSRHVPQAWQAVFRVTAERGTKTGDSLAL